MYITLVQILDTSYIELQANDKWPVDKSLKSTNLSQIPGGQKDRTQDPQYSKTAVLKNRSTQTPQSQKTQYSKTAVLKNRSTQNPHYSKIAVLKIW